MSELLANGLRTKDHFLRYIFLEEKCRGGGRERQAMKLLEEEVKKMGFDRIGLHVFAFNASAISLYESLGYEFSSMNMRKTLS